MGNSMCPSEEVAHLANVARDFCPFPDYSPSPHTFTMFTLNSSLHLKNHYAAVQSSLTPQQLEDFTQTLRTTFGRHGRVTHGGVGVVALSLALLFDTIARQVKGEWESQSEPIPGLFIKDLRGFYPPQVYTISKYLRLVPYIANNPTRMTEETERFLEKFRNEERSVAENFNNFSTKVEDTTLINLFMSRFVARGLNIHLMRIKNGTEMVHLPNYYRKADLVFNLNCDVEAASKEFEAAMPSFDTYTQESFQRCDPIDKGHPVLYRIAKLNLLNILLEPLFSVEGSVDSFVEHSEDFDLKANALGIWK